MSGDDQSRGFPHRPRLDEQAFLRRHLVDGEEKLVLHHPAAREVVEITPEQLEHLLACDGTRDLGGIHLAAAQRGAYRRASAIDELLA
ncbi:MAG: hypothetical protein KC731_23800, partial [Myxococcales bacterium]|nr:hypothetical protein [Myxococcales bacterium]